MRQCGLKAAVYMNNDDVINSVSVSGGVDSAVTLGLMKYAMNMENSPIQRILGISQPIHSSKWAYDRAIECANALGVEMIVVDQTPVFDSLVFDCTVIFDVSRSRLWIRVLESMERISLAVNFVPTW